MQGDACGIAVIIGAPDTEGTCIHGRVVIEDNEIVSDLYESECGIAVSNTRELVVKGNRTRGSKAALFTRFVQQSSIE